MTAIFLCPEEICAALWNLYAYYGQFENQVRNYMTSKSSEVRKKLQDFVKITRWNDFNYWSVVKTVEKTHEQLMKYMKEFQVSIDTLYNFFTSFAGICYDMCFHFVP